MDMTVGQIVVWCIIGLLAGSLAGLVVKGKKEGFGWVTNLIFGLIGAFVGGAAFDKLDIDLGLEEIVLDLNLVVAAFVGSLLVVVAARFIENRRRAKD
ncbi:MAG: GlsB/YeaQ/YmgE family stress response membrane protein [Planctomycetota bacterium]|nr:MAG: GlsB/YeaQ/YmgE family stress response membrane protein [Planctomycetota bacterium]